jgi:hypothetical protein
VVWLVLRKESEEAGLVLNKESEVPRLVLRQETEVSYLVPRNCAGMAGLFLSEKI